MMLKDDFGRVHDYLRISLTEKCNLRCSYCTPYDLPRGFYANANRMHTAEISEIVSEFVALGIKKVRITGGEPLVRREAKQIMKAISKLPVELVLTSNGILVNEFIGTFIVKINVVVMKGVNDDEILDFIERTKDLPLHIRFIEFMPFSGNLWIKEKVISHRNILQLAETKYRFSKLEEKKGSTSKTYKVDGFEGSFGVISTISEPFCESCNRIRLTADGKIKNCLFSKKETDILTPMRQGKDIRPLILQAIKLKKEQQGGQTDLFYCDSYTKQIGNRNMSSIGG